MISTPSPPSGFCTELSPLRIWGKWQSVRARRRKWDERQHWLAFHGFRTDHEMLLRLVPTQGEQEFLALCDSAQRGFPDEFPFRLKKHGYKKLVRAGQPLENQEGLHIQMATCAAISHRMLLMQSGMMGDNSDCRSVCSP